MDDHVDPSSTTIVVTGASTGIGGPRRPAARRSRRRDSRRGRSPQRTREIADSVGTAPILADSARLDDVHAVAAEILERCPRQDVVVNNAGLILTERRVTVDGHETMFQVNHLAPFPADVAAARPAQGLDAADLCRVHTAPAP
jgi:NAD(P)-dependent dehydrogenase (short-subunit alcohol dehydrogenase family)